MNPVGSIKNSHYTASTALNRVESEKGGKQFKDYLNTPKGDDGRFGGNYINPYFEKAKANGVYETNGYFAYLVRQPGEVVFDLSKIANRLGNQIAFPEVEVYCNGYNTVFRCYMLKPNSNELIRVQVSTPKHDCTLPMDEEHFMSTIGKAIMLIDKHLSMIQRMRDVIPSCIGGGFDYDPQKGTIDLKSYVEAIKAKLIARINGTYPMGNENVNYSADKGTLRAILKELEEFLNAILQ